MDDLSPVCELGSGTCGHVIKMKHNQTGYNMAVKVIIKKFIDYEIIQLQLLQLYYLKKNEKLIKIFLK